MSYRTEKEERVILALDRLHHARQGALMVLEEYYLETKVYINALRTSLGRDDWASLIEIVNEIEEARGVVRRMSDELSDAVGVGHE